MSDPEKEIFITPSGDMLSWPDLLSHPDERIFRSDIAIQSCCCKSMKKMPTDADCTVYVRLSGYDVLTVGNLRGECVAQVQTGDVSRKHDTNDR